MSLYSKAFIQGIGRIFSIPRLSVPLILTLGLTLGAVLSVISISSTLLYQPLKGVPNEASLQTFEYRFKMSETLKISYWNMQRLADISEYFSDLGQWAGIGTSEQDIVINNTAYPVTNYNASNNILDVLGAKLILGDSVTKLSPEKDVWISESLWQQAFSGAKSVIGKQLTVNKEIYIIAGVIEDVMAVNSNNAILNQQIWFITDLTTAITQPGDMASINNEIEALLLKSPNNQAIIPTLEQTNSWLDSYVQRHANGEEIQALTDFLSNTDKAVIGKTYRSNMLGDTENLIIALFAAVIGLLLMATLNLLNLFIAHYQSRTKEFSIQLSLGSSLLKMRLLVLLENLPSFLLASIAGLLVTGWALKSLPLIAGDSLPMIDSIGINLTTIISSIAIILLLSVLFSSLALIDIDKNALSNNLNSSGKGLQAQSNQFLSRTLMVIQLSIASILLTASVMLTMQSYKAVYQDLGYELGNTFNVSMNISDEEWIKELRDHNDYQTGEIKPLLEDVSELIERHVANSRVVIPAIAPLSDSIRVSVSRAKENNNQRVVYQVKNLSAEFFNYFNIQMLAGTNLTQTQIDNNEDRIVIDENMAKAIYPNLSNDEIIGKTIQFSSDNERPPSIVNGIVANTQSRTGITGSLGLPAVYSHRIDVNGTGFQFSVALPEGESMTAEMIDTQLKAQFPRFTNLQVTSLDEIWQTQTLNQRVSLWIVITMTGLTLLLAAIGVAGLTQMTTNHRKYELAVRMATGAKQIRLLNFILKDAVWMLLIGLGLGFIMSVFIYLQLTQHLDILPEFNWIAMSVLDIGLIGVVLLSVFMPAWRVISGDPMQALRQE